MAKAFPLQAFLTVLRNRRPHTPHTGEMTRSNRKKAGQRNNRRQNRVQVLERANAKLKADLDEAYTDMDEMRARILRLQAFIKSLEHTITQNLKMMGIPVPPARPPPD